MSNSFLFFGAIIFVILACGAALAQTVEPTILQPAPAPRERGQTQVDDGTGGRLTLSRQLMAQGSYLSAVSMLESLYSENPANRMLVDLLLTCYIELKAYDKAEMFLKRQLEQLPDDYRSNYLLLEVFQKDTRIQ